jgi:hypothetical protein
VTLPHLEFLTELPGLGHLEIKLGGTRNLQALSKLKALRYLELWLVKGLADLSVLAEIASLEMLYLQALRNVKQLPSFRSLTNLRHVYLETMKGLTDLRSIADAPALESLTLVDMPHLKTETFHIFRAHPALRYFRAGLGSLKRNAEAEALLGLPSSPTWISLIR